MVDTGIAERTTSLTSLLRTFHWPCKVGQVSSPRSCAALAST